MKKTLSLFAIIIIAATLLTLSVSAAATKDAEPADEGETLLFNFDSLGIVAGAEENSEFSAASSGGSSLLAVKLVKAGESKFNIAPDASVNATGCTYLQYWVDFSEITIAADDMVNIWVRLFDSNGAAVDSYGGKSALKYYTYEGGNWIEYTTDQYGRIRLPIGYAGYVRIELETLTQCISPYIGNKNPLDVTAVNKVWFRFNMVAADSTANVAKSYYLSDFKFVKGEIGAPAQETTKEIETTTPAPKDTTTPAPKDTTTPTPDVTEPAPQTTTATPEDNTIEQEGNGCGGSVMTVSIIAILAGVLILTKKKDD